MNISELRWNSNFADIFLKAIKELYIDIGDMNSRLDTGIYFFKKIFQLHVKFLFTVMSII